MPGRTGTSQAAVSSTCGLSQLEDNKGKGLEPPVGDREGLPTATEVTSLCKHNFPVSSTCSLFACYHLQTLPFRLWVFGGISPSVQFACINNILSNATTLTVQRSHGTGSWESIFNASIFVGLQCSGREGSITTCVTLGRWWLLSAQMAHWHLILS